MNIINLDPTFTPMGEGISYQAFNFPSGCEPHIKLLKKIIHRRTVITTRIRSSEDVMRLLLVTDALKRKGLTQIELFIPYLPFARQDRIMEEGEPFSLKVFAALINTQKYKKVYIYDAHSDVSLALIDNAVGLTNHAFVGNSLIGKAEYGIVSPDAGAYKKIFKVCQAIGYSDEIIQCNKVRNVHTGQIVKVTVDATDFGGKDLYIIDDICDGGGTFILLADELRKRNCGKIFLIISHGIFSKGIEALQPAIDGIYTTDSFRDILESDYIKQYKISLN